MLNRWLDEPGMLPAEWRIYLRTEDRWVNPLEPVYIDLHIHTSKNPDQLDAAYDVATLHEKVRACAMGSPHLISLTDHNTINKVAYLHAASLTTRPFLFSIMMCPMKESLASTLE